MGSIWSVRRARATHLIDQVPHAEEILTFYIRLAEVQERVADRVPASDWLTLVRAEERNFPWLRVEKLPLDHLIRPFQDFLSSVAEFGTETIKDGARGLLEYEDESLLEKLREVVDAWKPGEDTGEDVFHTRALLEPVVTSIAETNSLRPADWTRSFCFTCGGAPQVAVLRDLPDAVGQRSLICSMCATEWGFRRLVCPHCGETEADKLPVHTAESIAHVRVDACGTCSRYIKTVDLRKKGNAIPLVDELATVELDLWAQEQGLTKLRTNLVGL